MTDLPDIYTNEAAKVAAKDAEKAYNYAKDVLHARWDGPYKDLAEKTIAGNAYYAYRYAESVLKACWDGPSKDLAERTIAGDAYCAYFYAKDVLKARWDGPSKELAEKTILKSSFRKDYLNLLRKHDIQGYVALMQELSDKGEIKKIKVERLD